jgi:hypothetical protein
VKLKNQIMVIIVGLIFPWFFSGPLSAESTKDSECASAQEVFLADSGAQRHQFTQVSLSPLVVSGEIVGMVIVYDDATTERPADCLALYDKGSHLLAISWFDEFGIQRMAIDRGLLEEGDKLQGTLVIVLDGDSI